MNLSILWEADFSMTNRPLWGFPTICFYPLNTKGNSKSVGAKVKPSVLKVKGTEH